MPFISYSRRMANGMGFFERIFASLFGGTDPDSEKRRLLKAIGKDLSKSKFHFYKAGTHEVESSMAKFFYEMYKAIAPAQAMFQQTTPNAMKNVVIDSFLTPKQHAVIDEFTESNFDSLAHSLSLSELQSQLHKDIELVTSEFDTGNGLRIDNTYNQLSQLRNFCSYDFYFLLKKFDSNLREHDFSFTPHFQSISGAYIVEDLKNFIAIAWPLSFDGDWNDTFALLKRIKGTEPISLSLWKKILSNFSMLRTSRVFEMMIQLITEDPSYDEKINTTEEHITESYINQLQKQADGLISKVKQQQTSSKVDSLLSQLFGNSPIIPLKNYTPQMSSQFEKKNLGSYQYSVPLSYLKTFLLDYTKKEIRDLSDILLIRGKWATAQLSTPMSEAYNTLLDISNQVSAFDDSLAEEVDTGLKLKTFLPRAERDKEAANIIKITLRDVNDEAGGLLVQATENLIIYGRNLKMLLEDFIKQPNSELIINWKELDHFAEQNLKNNCVSVYKKIYLFVSLLQNFPVGKEQ